MNPVLIKCLSFISFHISFCSVFDHFMKKVWCKSISMRLEGSMAKWIGLMVSVVWKTMLLSTSLSEKKHVLFKLRFWKNSINSKVRSGNLIV